MFLLFIIIIFKNKGQQSIIKLIILLGLLENKGNVTTKTIKYKNKLSMTEAILIGRLNCWYLIVVEDYV